ncbi:MAG TPA: phosphate acetyltransferase [Burkholderiales bacterium]
MAARARRAGGHRPVRAGAGHRHATGAAAPARRPRAPARAARPGSAGRARAARRPDGRSALDGGACPRRPGQEGLRPAGSLMGAPEHKHEKYQRLIEMCKALPPTPTAVAHPCDESSLRGAVEAAEAGLIKPILVGPRARIEALARQHGLDVSKYEIVDAPHSEASAAAAAALVREGRAEALMKGSLHTDELMAAVVRRDAGLRTARRISHCFIMDVPGHPQPLMITDAAVNIAPTLKEKVDIVQNAIDLAHALGADEARVAILSAMETVNPDVPSTLEAAALCKMADRGQITGGILDGPLALDNAINLQAAQIKKMDSPVAGRANVLVVPDLEAGNMLAKSLSFLAGADAAGIVLGARVPIILTSRADAVMTRLASCAVAALLCKARREAAATPV